MTIATDPNPDSIVDSDDEFEKHFNEFATGKPAPNSEAQDKPGEPDGNGPEEEPPVPEEGGEPPKPAAETEPPPETATSGEAEPDGGSQPPEGEQAPDPWANAPPELIAERDRLQKERDEAEHRAKSDASRVAALSRKLQQLSMAPPSATPAPSAEPTEAQKALDDKIKKLREDYGDIADPLVELIEAQKAELDSVRTTLHGLNAAQQAQVIAQEEQALEARHPDWRNIAQSPDFSSWLQIQPENIQRLANSWDARETSVVLTLFKAENVEAGGQRQEASEPPAPTPKANAATDARRSQQLEGGRDVRSKPAPVASGPPEDFEAAFQYYAEKKRLEAAQNRR